jgi:hypothetical protein
MGSLSTWALVLSQAFELAVRDVVIDAKQVQQWTGTDAELMTWLDERHGWTPESELASNYLASLRSRLDGHFGDNAPGHLSSQHAPFGSVDRSKDFGQQ